MSDIGHNSGTLSKENKDTIKQGIDEISDYFREIDSFRNNVKDVVDAVVEKTGIDKKKLRRLARTAYKKSYLTDQQENAEFEVLWNEIMQ